MTSINPSKITPEQKKFIQSQTTSSVFTEQEIASALGNADELIAINEATIASLTAQQVEVLTQVQEDSSLFIQGPTRAQDQFSLRQASTALMSQVPRQKFEYLATFRFASDSLFQTIFGDDRIEGLDQSIQSYQGTVPYSKTTNNLKQSRAQVIDAVRRSLVFNIKQIDGPKINFQYDTLNQYNRKRNVYRRVDYDPVNIRFYDTMDNSALKLFRYLYELNLKDGRNRNREYGGDNVFNKGLYQSNPLTSEDDFINQHNFGLDSSVSNTTYPIKSLDLFLIHGGQYNLIRFVHPKIISMDHDVLSYESSVPVELGMQFAYETVIYETLNHSMANAKDVTIDFDEILQNSLTMPATPGITIAPEGSNGTFEPNNDWSEVAANLSTFITSESQGDGSTLQEGNVVISTDGNVANTISTHSVIASTGSVFGKAYSSEPDKLSAKNYTSNPSSNLDSDKLSKNLNGNVSRIV
tara:strand:- start:3241 stop:4644 length:1404 start_codon:yes stop_codon:yes gene_type:complete